MEMVSHFGAWISIVGSKGREVMKRCFDILASLLLLIILSPLFAFLSFLVRQDGGPAIYRQKRLTRDRQVFQILKFRTMSVCKTDDISIPCVSQVTPSGAPMRKYHLDELPQLVNILRGEMSFVGPRPERPELAEKYEQDLPEFALRLKVKAGLTGYAQVHGEYDTLPAEKILMDLWYITHPGIWTDVKIMLETAIMLVKLWIVSSKSSKRQRTDAERGIDSNL